MRARSFTVLAAAAIAATALAWKPGGDYAGSGASTNTPAYDPFLGNILPLSANVQVLGRIATNDMAVFTDRSGRYVRGTNFIGMVEAAASNAAASAGYATTGQVAAAVAAAAATSPPAAGVGDGAALGEAVVDGEAGALGVAGAG